MNNKHLSSNFSINDKYLFIIYVCADEKYLLYIFLLIFLEINNLCNL